MECFLVPQRDLGCFCAGAVAPKLAPEAKRGVVHCARLRKAAHWPNNNANPSGLSEKKVYCVEKRDMCDPQGKNPIFGLPRG